MLTVDANVFVSAATPTKVFHADSDRFLTRVGTAGLELICPTLVLPETTSGVIRPTGNSMAGQQAVIRMTTFPNLTLIPLTALRTNLAAQIVINHRLRGADAVYVAVAQEFGTTLIIWDAEMLARGPAAVPTLTPTDWLIANPNVEEKQAWISKSSPITSPTATSPLRLTSWPPD